MKTLIAYVLALFSLFFLGSWAVMAQTNTPTVSPTETETPTNTVTPTVTGTQQGTPSGAPRTGFGTMSQH